jgi:two-component system chemotaxis response regulator CheY
MSKCVLIVDDSADVRTRIRFDLERSGLKVCGEAVDGLDAIEKASALRPDLIILDLSMPRVNGIAAAEKLRAICPKVPIILYTLHADIIRSGPTLPVGVTEVVSKSENLLDRVLNLLQTHNTSDQVSRATG